MALTLTVVPSVRPADFSVLRAKLDVMCLNGTLHMHMRPLEETEGHGRNVSYPSRDACSWCGSRKGRVCCPDVRARPDP